MSIERCDLLLTRIPERDGGQERAHLGRLEGFFGGGRVLLLHMRFVNGIGGYPRIPRLVPSWSCRPRKEGKGKASEARAGLLDHLVEQVARTIGRGQDDHLAAAIDGRLYGGINLP